MVPDVLLWFAKRRLNFGPFSPTARRRQEPHYLLNATQTEFDGKRFGVTACGANLKIPPFLGTKKIVDLPVLPLEYYPDKNHVRELLILRGRRFEELARKEFLQYDGLALGEIDYQKRVQSIYHVKSRVYIDAKTFFRVNPDRSIHVAPYTADIPEEKHRGGGEDEENEEDEEDDGFVPVNAPLPPGIPPPYPPGILPLSQRRRHAQPVFNPFSKEADTKNVQEFLALTDEQCLTATAIVRGFDFASKKWLEFLIPNLSTIVWNEAAFSRLVIPASQKKLVHSLVSSNLKHSASGKGGFDDVIKGKGQGLVLVLHGPPGSGKTLTAEATAELNHRPLYTVSSGELGTDPFDLEQKLSSILDIASTWRCVLLLDEADVFLEKRSMHDLQRNALVSIFLRLLEYYTGILFLTTNRVTTFDPAFQSRIHVALKYEELGQDARKSVWKGFLEDDIDENGLQKLSERKANGREIKNAIKTCKSLVEMEEAGDGKIGLEGLLEVLDMRGAFEKDFNGEII